MVSNSLFSAATHKRIYYVVYSNVEIVASGSFWDARKTIKTAIEQIKTEYPGYQYHVWENTVNDLNKQIARIKFKLENPLVSE